MSTCPSKSPETGTKCTLEDTKADHYLGHEGFDDRNGGVVVSWGTTGKDKIRWRANAED